MNVDPDTAKSLNIRSESMHFKIEWIFQLFVIKLRGLSFRYRLDFFSFFADISFLSVSDLDPTVQYKVRNDLRFI